jgi:hypothetical protein
MRRAKTHVRRPRGHGRAAKRGKRRAAKGRNWSGDVTRNSNALDLAPRVFTWKDPRQIARSLKRSAEQSRRRKFAPMRSALSMLTFYINRAGRNLPKSRKLVLERAKAELKRLYARD